MAGQAKIKTIKVTLQNIGGSPLKMNPMSMDQLLDMRAGRKAVRNKEEAVEAEAARKIYNPLDYGAPEGTLGIPRVNLFAALCEAGRQITYTGKTKISTATSSWLPMIITFEEGRRFFAFDNQKAEWKTDVVKGTNPNGGEAVVIVRPAFYDWAITLTIEVKEATGVKAETIFDLFALAGEGIGLCDHRPNKRGESGRFKIVEWETIDERDADSDKDRFFKNKVKKVARATKIVADADAADLAEGDMPEGQLAEN